MKKIELTILMPCLNEEDTVGICIRKAKKYLEKNHISGEVLIVDNGSLDRSSVFAYELGARVVLEPKKGYGNALRRGFKEARGKYIIYGDCDDSYDFSNLNPYYDKLKEGYSLVNGNRFLGGIEKGAMSFSHRLGVPFLSWLGRRAYHVPFYDFHCGLRGVIKKDLPILESEGMEFATEIIYKFAKEGKKMSEIPTTLGKDGRGKPSHLRTVRDGFRHLNYMRKHRLKKKKDESWS